MKIADPFETFLYAAGGFAIFRLAADLIRYRAYLAERRARIWQDAPVKPQRSDGRELRALADALGILL